MGTDEEPAFALPVIPYFYHDIVARIIPGLIQLGLVGALATYHLTGVPRSPQIQELKVELDTLFGASQLATALMLLAAAYFVGVLFEGFLGRWLLNYDWAFRRATRKVRQRHGVVALSTGDEMSKLANEASCILESYEPVVPHFFARSTRFLAEAKMMTFSAVAIPIAFVAIGSTTGHLLPPGGIMGIVSVVALFLSFAVAGISRQQRRAVEILRCIEYLALRTEPADASARARRAWAEVLASGKGANAPASVLAGAAQQAAAPDGREGNAGGRG
jgi:hypothetical protein